MTVAELTPPELPAEAAFAYGAFSELATDRATGMSLGPIPFSSIDRYACRYGITDLDQFDFFRCLIRAIEREQDRQRAESK